MTEEGRIDIKSFNRVFSGDNNYTIPTMQILELNQKVADCLEGNACGAIIHGKARAGKTRSIIYISKYLKQEYGSELPVVLVNANSPELTHGVTQKAFYQQMLVTVKHEEPYKGTTVQLRQRLMNRLIEYGLDTKYRRIVFFVDEAYQLDEKEYDWLIDIYNELAQSNIMLTVFLFGTRELLEQKRGFIANKKEQIVRRFMSKEYVFHGIQNKKELEVCLTSLDKEVNIDGKTIIVSKYFFPEAYKDGRTMNSYSSDLWNAFVEVKARESIKEDEILMSHFMETVRLCLVKFGSAGKGLYAPKNENWIECIEESGYVTTQV